jgi:hypothetical protein
MTEAGFVEGLVQLDAEDVHLLDAHARNIRSPADRDGDPAPNQELEVNGPRRIP